MIKPHVSLFAAQTLQDQIYAGVYQSSCSSTRTVSDLNHWQLYTLFEMGRDLYETCYSCRDLYGFWSWGFNQQFWNKTTTGKNSPPWDLQTVNQPERPAWLLLCVYFTCVPDIIVRLSPLKPQYLHEEKIHVIKLASVTSVCTHWSIRETLKDINS